VLASALAVTSCGPTGASTESPIRVDGSSTVFPITQAAAQDFLKGTPSARVADAFSGTTAGFEKFCTGQLDVQNASRPIRAAEDAACRTRRITYLELPIAYDGITVVVHPRNTWADAMTVDELRAIWAPAATGRATTWKHVRAGWPDREIHLFGPGPKSGTFDFFTGAIVGKQDASRTDYTASEDDNVIINGVAGDELALGYVGYDYFEKSRQRLKGVAIDDGDQAVGIGAIAPTALNVRRGVYRPLSRPLFIYVNLASVARPEVEKFLTRYLRQADMYATSAGAIGLRTPEYELVRARWMRRQAGSAFMAANNVGANVELVLGTAR
jgi:phosphate transport system substrate-binding protein